MFFDFIYFLSHVWIYLFICTRLKIPFAEAAVAKINSLAQSQNIRWVFITGDLTSTYANTKNAKIEVIILFYFIILLFLFYFIIFFCYSRLSEDEEEKI